MVGPDFTFSPFWSTDEHRTRKPGSMPSGETAASLGSPGITSFRRLTAHTQSMSWYPSGAWLTAGAAERAERYTLRISMNGKSQVVERRGG
jgi:hypothetical protein